MKTIYYVINKSDMSACTQMRNPHDVSVFMLGRRLGNYIIVKDDDKPPRVILLMNPDIAVIERQLENG